LVAQQLALPLLVLSILALLGSLLGTSFPIFSCLADTHLQDIHNLQRNALHLSPAKSDSPFGLSDYHQKLT
jgi:hypothetical protein